MTTELIDLYKVLGLTKEATYKDIKKAYRNLAKELHPDVNDAEDAQEKFQEVLSAYEILSDEQLRAEYDEKFEAQEIMKEQRNVKFQDVFYSFFSNSSNALKPLDGRDVTITVHFTVPEAFEETKKDSIFNRSKICTECDGKGILYTKPTQCKDCEGKGVKPTTILTPFGKLQVSEECDTCQGTTYKNPQPCTMCGRTGKIPDDVKIQITLPQDVHPGKRVVFEGHGEIGVRGGKTGDLIVVFEQSPTDTYKIEYDYDVVSKLNIPLKTALLGGDIEVTKPNGEKETVKVPKATTNGSRLALGNMGLLNSKKNERGLCYVELSVSMPTDLSQADLNKLSDIL